MNILIIGNGFDLAHDLNTSYKDFLEHCSNLPANDEFKNNLWLKHFISVNLQADSGDTWIDLEKEIYNVIKKIGKGTNSYPYTLRLSNDFKIYYSYINQSSTYIAELNNIKYSAKELDKMSIYLYDQLRDFTKAFEKYLIENVLSELNDQSKYQLSLKAVGVQQGNKDVRVLSFNYTDTCERLYQNKFNTYCELNIKPIYVHGKADIADDCNLVLGIHSFDINKDLNSTIPMEFNVFKKHNQRHKYGTIEAYQDLLRELTFPRKIIRPIFHVIGHSLDKTDRKILRHIFLANDNAVINIYYHNEEAQERLINNIAEIITEEEVMARVRFIYQHDKKYGLLIEVG